MIVNEVKYGRATVQLKEAKIQSNLEKLEAAKSQCRILLIPTACLQENACQSTNTAIKPGTQIKELRNGQ